MILNHIYLESGAKHFNLLKINTNFGLNILNRIGGKSKFKFKLLVTNKNNKDINKSKNIDIYNDNISKINSTMLNVNNNEDSSEQTDKIKYIL